MSKNCKIQFVLNDLNRNSLISCQEDWNWSKCASRDVTQPRKKTMDTGNRSCYGPQELVTAINCQNIYSWATQKPLFAPLCPHSIAFATHPTPQSRRCFSLWTLPYTRHCYLSVRCGNVSSLPICGTNQSPKYIAVFHDWGGGQGLYKQLQEYEKCIQSHHVNFVYGVCTMLRKHKQTHTHTFSLQARLLKQS